MKRKEAKPDPRIYLDMRALRTAQDPASFFADLLTHLYPDNKRAAENAAFLRWISKAVAEDRQLESNDPTLLMAVGNVIADGKARRALRRYLAAVDAAVRAAEDHHRRPR